MEVTVLEAVGLPSKPIIAIRAGGVGRHQKLEVNQPFLIPHPGSRTCAVQLSLLQEMASETLPPLEDSGLQGVEFCVAVERPNGQPSQVKLRCTRTGEKVVSPINTAAVDQDYLTEHRLQEMLQDLVSEVLKDQPQNPYRYILARLKDSRSGSPASADGREATPPLLQKEPMAEPAPEAEDKESSPQPEEEATPAAAYVVPKPPVSPSSGTSPRKARNYSQAGKDAASPEPEAAPAASAAEAVTRVPPSPEAAAANRGEARKAARASIGMVFVSAKVTETGAESLRAEVQRSMSSHMARSIVIRAREAEVATLRSSRDVRQQSKVAVRGLLEKAVVLLSPEYRQAITKWAVNLSMRGAANVIAQDGARRGNCFQQENRRMSVPTPIVSLAAESNSWGAWLR